MSSVVIWRDKATGVTASWNKQALHSVFVPLRIDEHGICDGRTTEWRGEQAAVRAAEAAAKERLEEMRAEDPKKKRFRVTVDGQRVVNSELSTHDRSRLWADPRFDQAALAEIDELPVTGTLQTTSKDDVIIVQRVE